MIAARLRDRATPCLKQSERLSECLRYGSLSPILALLLLSVMPLSVEAQPLPEVSITATVPDAAEEGCFEGCFNQFTVTRTGDTTADLTVHYTVGGTATPGADYSALPGNVTIDADDAEVIIFVAEPVDDLEVEGDETVVLTLNADPSYVIGSPDEATVTIADNDFPPEVNITTTEPGAAEFDTECEGPCIGVLTLTRMGGDTDSDLTVLYTVDGPATPGADYIALSGDVTILAGDLEADILITPVDDLVPEDVEGVVVNLTDDPSYTIGFPFAATVFITDNDGPPEISITTEFDAAEAGCEGTCIGRFTLTRTPDTTADLTVHYTVGGTATPGADYTALPGSVTFPGSTSGGDTVDIDIFPVNDLEFEDAETVVVTLTDHPSYVIGSPDAATVTIADNDLPTVSIRAIDSDASEDLDEGGPDRGRFRVTRSGTTSADLFVHLSVDGTATPVGEESPDYTAAPTPLTLVVVPAGSATATIEIMPIDDGLEEGDETVVLTLEIPDDNGGADYIIGRPSGATVTITDTTTTPPVPIPELSITSTDADASEAGPDSPER